MNRIVRLMAYLIIAIVLLAIGAAVVGAQTTEQRLAALEAKVALQDSIIGVRKFQAAQIPCSLMEAQRPTKWFPNGEYDLAFRNRQFGCAFDPLATTTYGLQAAFTGWATRLSIVETKLTETPSNPVTPPIAYSLGAGVTVPAAGEIEFRSNLSNAPTQGGITDSYYALCNINGWDGGFRCHQNWAHRGTKLLPVAVDGFDSRGAWSYNWWPAELGGESSDNAPFTVTNAGGSHPYRGQTLIIDGGSQAAYDYSTGAQLYSSRAVLVAAQRAGWPMYFAVSPTRPNGYPTNRAVMKLNSDDSPNPVEVVIEGQLRRLRSCNIGGVTVVCF